VPHKVAKASKEGDIVLQYHRRYRSKLCKSKYGLSVSSKINFLFFIGFSTNSSAHQGQHGHPGPNVIKLL
jgi:hypothetical protein